METEMERTGGDGRRHVADAVNDYSAQVSESVLRSYGI